MSPRRSSALVLLIPLLFCALSSCNAAKSKALVVNVTQDSTTLQYTAKIQQKTPLQTESLVLDLTGDFVWLQCDNGTYRSSTYRPVHCGTAVCAAAESIACGNCFGPPEPGCNNNTCGVFPENTVTRTMTSGDLSRDVVAAYSTDGKNPGPSHSPRFCLFLRARLSSERIGQRNSRHGRIEPGSLGPAYSVFPRLRL